MDTSTSLNIMERVMFSLNLRNPISRFAGLFVATNGIVWLVKPSYFFDPVTSQPSPQSVVPWWALGLITGGAAAFFL